MIRADAREAQLLAGAPVGNETRRAANILQQGPSLVALAVGGPGNLLAWPGGDIMLPLTRMPVADTPSAGDAFMAALIAALARGDPPQRAGRLDVAAAGATVGHAGGRPDLIRQPIDEQLGLLNEAETEQPSREGPAR